MQKRSSDEDEYRLFTTADAAVTVRLSEDEHQRPELQVFGNRTGLLSLANVLLWLVANSWRREFLSLAERPFTQFALPLSVGIRILDADATGQDGVLCRIDRGEQLEWALGEDDLQRVALLLHSLASNPAHEYDRLQVAEESFAGIYVRMTDAADWIR